MDQECRIRYNFWKCVDAGDPKLSKSVHACQNYTCQSCLIIRDTVCVDSINIIVTLVGPGRPLQWWWRSVLRHYTQCVGVLLGAIEIIGLCQYTPWRTVQRKRITVNATVRMKWVRYLQHFSNQTDIITTSINCFMGTEQLTIIQPRPVPSSLYQM